MPTTVCTKCPPPSFATLAVRQRVVSQRGPTWSIGRAEKRRPHVGVVTVDIVHAPQSVGRKEINNKSLTLPGPPSINFAHARRRTKQRWTAPAKVAGYLRSERPCFMQKFPVPGCLTRAPARARGWLQWALVIIIIFTYLRPLSLICVVNGRWRSWGFLKFLEFSRHTRRFLTPGKIDYWRRRLGRTGTPSKILRTRLT